MESYLYYLLRASIVTVLFYGFYRLFFCKNTFHRINRFSLISIVFLVLVLPVFRFNLMPEKKADLLIETGSMGFSDISVIEFMTPQPQIEIPWVQILTALYAIGFIFTVVRYLIGFSQITAIIRKSEKQTLADHTVLCVADKHISPFSWMKYIVLARAELSADNNAVICHEREHIHLRHSLDMIFFDIFTCIFWFNPFSWLLRREIQSVHEYQADEQVLSNGIDSQQYQFLLIRKSVGEYKFALANNFRQRDLHKRITMMKKNKTNRRMKWSYAMAFPALFIAMMALSVPKLNANIREKKSEETVEREKAVSIQARDSVFAGNVVLNVSLPALGKTEIASQDSVLSIDSKENSNIIISHKLKDSPFVIVDEKRITTDEFQQLKPEDIESVSVLKGKTAIDIYGDDAKNGVVLITTKNSNKNVIAIGSGSMDSIRADMKGLIIRTKENSPQYLDLLTENSPLIIVDGEKMSKDFDLNSVNPKEIESISVLKDKSATDVYGDEGKNGVILVTTKKASIGGITNMP